MPHGPDRRTFTAAVAVGWWAFADGRAPAVLVADKDRPIFPSGVQSGDVTDSTAVVWARCDREARLFVEVATSDSFKNARTVRGPDALDATEHTAKLDLTSLPSGEQVFYRVTFQDLNNTKISSEPIIGSFRTAPRGRRDVLFAWSGDTCGQGYGINPDVGGLKVYDTIRKLRPDFFIHSGDMIYADNPLTKEVRVGDKVVWKNVVTEAKSKVAETLAEFRGNFAYNLLDDHLKKFNAEVPLYVQWDDHEVRNNWYPGQVLDDKRYKVKSVSLLAARGKRAFFEYNPIRDSLRAPQRVYRSFRYGPTLELFLIDMRSHRAPNSSNRQKTAGPETALLGAGQLRWLKEGLLRSRATWKVIASDMPLGLVVPDIGNTFEAVANGDGPPLGRELEIAELLKFIKTNRIHNVVWLTADVHYAAAHYYDPTKAQFTEFEAFWEFVAGPLHAGTFGPNALDNTFGPQVKFLSIPKDLKPNRPPSEGLQFFGTVGIEAKTETMTVALYNAAGKNLYQVTLPPQLG